MLNQRSTRQAGFTLVEVMMASLILVVGFVGLIQAVGISSNMMDTARRQTLAAQIISHEIEKLRLLPWDDPASTNDIVGLPTTPTSITIDTQFRPVWSSTATYNVDSMVIRNGIWYRCLISNTNRQPPNSTYWATDTLPPAGLVSDTNFACGATFTLSRSVAEVDADLREVTFTVTWEVKTSRRNDDGSLVIFTYTRKNAAYFGKYGLNLTFQRS